MIAVIMNFRKVNKNTLEHRATDCLSSRKKKRPTKLTEKERKKETKKLVN